jgi:hypothetical protein
MGPIIAAAVERKHECLASVTKKATSDKEGGQVGFQYPASYHAADSDIDVRLRARRQSVFLPRDLMDLAGITRTSKDPEGRRQPAF